MRTSMLIATEKTTPVESSRDLVGIIDRFRPVLRTPLGIRTPSITMSETVWSASCLAEHRAVVRGEPHASDLPGPPDQYAYGSLRFPSWIRTKTKGFRALH